MPTELDDIVYYDTNPVRPYVDYYCPIADDIPEEDGAEQTLAEVPRQREIVPSSRPARVRPYVFTHMTTHGEQLTLPLMSSDEVAQAYQANEPIEEEYSPERLAQLQTAHENAKRNAGGEFRSARQETLLAIIQGLRRL